MLFENRRSRCKESPILDFRVKYWLQVYSVNLLLLSFTAIRGSSAKVPQAYRVYVEDTFLPYDAADACIFSRKTTPEFYVFYNGEENYPVNTTLKLSDAFITRPEQLPLELTVKVFNINTDKENPLLKSCKTLDEYSLFVEEVRIQKRLDPENGFTNAVKTCIAKGILKEYLQRKSREVINMLVAEYDYDTDIAVQRKESLMLGIQQGIEQGFADGVRQTAKNLLDIGLSVENISKATGLSSEEIENL